MLVLFPIKGQTAALVFIIAFAAMNFPATMCGIAWTSMMGEMFSSSMRGRIFGERNMLCTLVSLGATAAAGPLLDRIAWPWNYMVIFLLSFAALLGSLYYLSCLQEKPVHSDSSGQNTPGMSGFWAATLDRRFLRFLEAVFAIHVGLHLPASLWTILLVRIMGLSNAWLAAFSTVSGLCSVLSYRS